MGNIQVGPVGFELLGSYDIESLLDIFRKYSDSLKGNIIVKINLCSSLPNISNKKDNINYKMLQKKDGSCGSFDCLKLECTIWVLENNNHFESDIRDYFFQILKLCSHLFGAVILECSILKLKDKVTVLIDSFSLYSSYYESILKEQGEILYRGKVLLINQQENSLIYPIWFQVEKSQYNDLPQKIDRIVFIDRSEKNDFVELNRRQATCGITDKILNLDMKNCDSEFLKFISHNYIKNLQKDISIFKLEIDDETINSDMKFINNAFDKIYDIELKLKDKNNSNEINSAFICKNEDCISRSSLKKCRIEIFNKRTEQLWGITNLAYDIWELCDEPKLQLDIINTIRSDKKYLNYNNKKIIEIINIMEEASLLKRKTS